MPSSSQSYQVAAVWSSPSGRIVATTHGFGRRRNSWSSDGRGATGMRRVYAEGHDGDMEVAALVIAALFALVTAVAVIALFVWAARRDGEHDRALQARLGIRRRTRLGR